MQKYPQIKSHQSLATIAPSQSVSSPAVQEWIVLKEMAQSMISTGFLAKGLANPQQVIFMIMAGKELGMGPMWSVQNLLIVDGKVSAKAESMLALVFKNCPGAQINFLQNDATACRLEASRPGGKMQPFGFSMDDAKQARLDGKDNWKKYPRAMLRSRAVSEMCRALFPEAIAGICSYTPEEILDMRDDPKSEPERVTIHPPIPVQIEAPQRSLRQMFKEDFKLEESDLAEFCGVTEIGPEHSGVLRDLYRDMTAGAITRSEVVEFAKDTVEES